MNPVKDWVQTYSSDKRSKEHNLEMFCEWLKTTPEELLAIRRKDPSRGIEKLCIKFVNYLTEEKDYQLNTAVNKIGTIRSFFRYHDLDLRFKRNELPKATLKPRKFSLTIEHIRRMFEYANIWEKALMLFSTETGLRVSDILAMKRTDIENILTQEIPNMEIQTKKEGVLARIFVSKELKGILDLYLPTLKASQRRLFKKDEDTLNKAVQRLFKTAYPEIKEVKPTMHDFRRLFISTATNLNVNQWRIRYFVGKKIPDDILVYLRDLDLRSDFLRLKSKLTIQESESVSANQIGNLEEMIQLLARGLMNIIARQKTIETGMTYQKENTLFVKSLKTDLDIKITPKKLEKFLKKELRL